MANGIAASTPRSPEFSKKGCAMFDAECDIAALVYEADQEPDATLSDFASDLKAHGYRAVGMVQTGQCADSSLSAVLLHNGEKLLLAQEPDPSARGCKLDISRLLNAGERVAQELEQGADILIINRFGKRERDGKGLTYLIDRAFEANVPVVIAVSREYFADWIKFAEGMTVKLACDRNALDVWWRGVSMRASRTLSAAPEHPTANQTP
jgi:nucleoside-triphosphatase THEP1